MYQIIIDRPRSLVFARVSGFLDSQTIAEIVAQTRLLGNELRQSSGRFDLLCDLTATKVTSSEAAGGYSDLLGNPSARHLWADRIAYVTASALLRLQIERAIAARSDVRVFGDRRTALAWLQEAREKIAA